MQKLKQPLAKLLVFALVLSLFAGTGPTALNALAADFLAGTIPTQAHLYVEMDQYTYVSGDAYIGWRVNEVNLAKTYTGYATKYEGKYYTDGFAAYNGSYYKEVTETLADGSVITTKSEYYGYFSSTDLKKWTLLTTPVADEVWAKGERMVVSIPLDYQIVMTSGKRVKVFSDNPLRTTDGLVGIPAVPVYRTEEVTHKVAAGETLAKLAQRYNIEVEDIKYDNYNYFSDLSTRNEKQGTEVQLEAGVSLTINARKYEGVNYKVQKGDKLWGISFNYYGDMTNPKVGEIMSANKAYFDKTKGVLEAGVTIFIPEAGIRMPIDISRIEGAAGIYRVQRGDTLGSIAKKYYGTEDAIEKIYAANSEYIKKVGKSYMIYEQQWLVITI